MTATQPQTTQANAQTRYEVRRGDLPLSHPEAPPLIFAGGPTATSNPEPFAAFFDFIALGDGEELLPEIGLVVSEARASGLSRRELLRGTLAIGSGLCLQRNVSRHARCCCCTATTTRVFLRQILVS